MIVAALAIGIAGASVREIECPSLGTVKLPHPRDCTLYYVCQDGESTMHECLEGLHFNNATKQCDWPSGCIPKESWPETQPSIPEEEESETSACIGTCPTTDPKDKTIHLLYKGDCAKFCACSNGTPILMNCPAGLHFDIVKGVCNWPWLAKCQQ